MRDVDTETVSLPPSPSRTEETESKYEVTRAISPTTRRENMRIYLENYLLYVYQNLRAANVAVRVSETPALVFIRASLEENARKVSQSEAKR